VERIEDIKKVPDNMVPELYNTEGGIYVKVLLK